MRTSRGLKWKNVQAQRSIVKVVYNFVEAWSFSTIDIGEFFGLGLERENCIYFPFNKLTLVF